MVTIEPINFKEMKFYPSKISIYGLHTPSMIIYHITIILTTTKNIRSANKGIAKPRLNLISEQDLAINAVTSVKSCTIINKQQLSIELVM